MGNQDRKALRWARAEEVNRLRKDLPRADKTSRQVTRVATNRGTVNDPSKS